MKPPTISLATSWHYGLVAIVASISSRQRLALFAVIVVGGFANVAFGIVGPAPVTHYDVGALTPVADGTIVMQIGDVSGNNNHATGSGGIYVANGIGGLPSVQFATNNVDDGYHSLYSMGTQFGIQGDSGWTQVFVVRLANTYAGSPTARPIFGGLGNGYTFGGMAGMEVENTGSDSARFDVAGGNSTDVVLNPGNSFSPYVNRDVIITASHQGNTGQPMLNTTRIFVNGDAPGEGDLLGYSIGATGNAASTTLNLRDEPISLGTTFAQGYVGFNGLLSEVMIYDRALADEERRQVEIGLIQKYGIGAPPAPVQWAVNDGGNGHWYEAVGVSDPYPTWTGAKAMAESRTFNGMKGYLASITSAAENDFITNNLPEAVFDGYWIGGYQDVTAQDYTEPSGGWRWTSGEPFSYTNWFRGGGPGGFQPDNGDGQTEHFAHLHSKRFVPNANGQWNDARNAPGGFSNFTRGFVVEYSPVVPEPSAGMLALLGFTGVLVNRSRTKRHTAVSRPTSTATRN